MQPSRPPTENFGRPIHDTPVFDRQRDENLERETAKLRAHFEAKMANKTPGHRKVAVLILYWGSDYDKGVLEVADEVKQLRETFTLTYGFNVYERKLTTAPGKAKDSIYFHMADFMLKENFEDTLLIIYYAGHGGLAMGTTDGLKLTGAHSLPGRVDTGKDIVWDKAEALIEDAKADMLLIFDCCHAARAGNRKRRSPFSQRIYEVLAACQVDELTPVPGTNSFTSALIWALKELAEPPRAFTTSQLYEKILNSPVYKLEDDLGDGYIAHHPYWSEKAGYHSLHRLKITPKSVQDQQLAEPASQPAKFDMHIQLLSTEIPSVPDISKLCQKLKDVLHPDDPGSTFHQVLWKDFAPAQVQKQHFQHLAELVHLKLKQNKLQNQINQLTEGNSGGPEVPMSSFTQDDIISSQTISETRTVARRRSSSAASLPTKTTPNGQLDALQGLARDSFGWLVTGMGLILLGYYLGKSSGFSGR